jgi:tetratricopeptide (TPR) repeat protein
MKTQPLLTVMLGLALALCALPAVAGEGEPDDKPELVNFDRLWNFRKPGETEKRFRELLPAAEASGNLEYRLQLLTQIGRTLGLQGKFEEAHEVLDGVEKELTKETPVARMRYLLERGRTFNSSKKKEKATALFLEAWEFGAKAKLDFYALDAAHMMGIVAEQEKKLAWSEKAMHLAETSKDERCKLWLGSLYNNIGWTLYYQGRYEEALEIHRKGWDWRKERGQPRPMMIAQWSVAKVLRALGRHQEALALQRELLAVYEEMGEESGFTHEEVGENLLAMGKGEEAKPHFEKAWKLLKDIKWLDDDEPGRRERLRRLAGAEE